MTRQMGNRVVLPHGQRVEINKELNNLKEFQLTYSQDSREIAIRVDQEIVFIGKHVNWDDILDIPDLITPDELGDILNDFQAALKQYIDEQDELLRIYTDDMNDLLEQKLNLKIDTDITNVTEYLTDYVDSQAELIQDEITILEGKIATNTGNIEAVLLLVQDIFLEITDLKNKDVLQDQEILGNKTSITAIEQEIRDIVIPELDGKVEKVEGKGLSDTNFTQTEKDKLAALAKATKAEAELGTNDTRYMTPLKTKDAIGTADIDGGDL